MLSTTKTARTFLMFAITVLSLAATAMCQSEVPASKGVQRLTLAEAQERATGNPMARVGELMVDAAKYHRQAAEADYYPKVGSTFANFHFNKFMGQTIQLARRSAAVPLMNKDQTIVAFTVTQPLTPIFKIRELVNIAKADERIAQAKAAKMVAGVSSNIEQAFFALLIAQRQQTLAELKTKTLESKVLLASTDPTPSLAGTTEHQAAFLEASKELVNSRSRVMELTSPLNALIGFSPETMLELVEPLPVTLQTVSLMEATQQAMIANPEIVEAEQTVVKARAAAKLGKLDYIPDVAVMGGYSYQTAIDLLPSDFSFIGVVATFNVFDFGKREKTLKERKTNVELAQMNLAGVKAKVAAGVQKAFFEVERTRRIRDLTRQLTVTYQAAEPFQKVAMDAGVLRAKAEAEMFQAELDYRLAYLQLKRVVGDQ